MAKKTKKMTIDERFDLRDIEQSRLAKEIATIRKHEIDKLTSRVSRTVRVLETEVGRSSTTEGRLGTIESQISTVRMLIDTLENRIEGVAGRFAIMEVRAKEDRIANSDDGLQKLLVEVNAKISKLTEAQATITSALNKVAAQASAALNGVTEVGAISQDRINRVESAVYQGKKSLDVLIAGLKATVAGHEQT